MLALIENYNAYIKAYDVYRIVGTVILLIIKVSMFTQFNYNRGLCRARDVNLTVKLEPIIK